VNMTPYGEIQLNLDRRLDLAVGSGPAPAVARAVGHAGNRHDSLPPGYRRSRRTAASVAKIRGTGMVTAARGRGDVRAGGCACGRPAGWVQGADPAGGLAASAP
jgi:hypothetical protein